VSGFTPVSPPLGLLSLLRICRADEAIPRKGPKPYFFQDLDLSKIEKIIKCEAITTGA
jgi:hypothetical protein